MCIYVYSDACFTQKTSMRHANKLPRDYMKSIIPLSVFVTLFIQLNDIRQNANKMANNLQLFAVKYFRMMNLSSVFTIVCADLSILM